MTRSTALKVATSAIAVAAVASVPLAIFSGDSGDPASPRKWGPAPGTLFEPTASTSRAAPGSPNFLLLTADDMAVGDLAVMPNTKRWLKRQGTELTQGLAPTPICVPARASLLTGQYAHNHGAVTISGPGGGFKAFNDRNTLPVWLKAAGYRTSFAGKYLNGYGVRQPRYVPPGWDRWYGSVDMTTYAIYNTTYNDNGTPVRRPEHNSDVMSAVTRTEIKRGGEQSKPWFMWVNYVAPHHGGGQESDDPTTLGTTKPATRHRNRFASKPLPRRPAMFEGGGSPWAGPPVSRSLRKDYREMYQQRLESLLSVDEAVGTAVRTLRRTGQLDNTYIILTSDNGFMVGEHNRSGKLIPYDPSLRVPMVVRGPGIPAGKRSSTPTTNPDLAVTIAALAGARPGRDVDGVDMSSYWRRRADYDRPIPIRGYPVQSGEVPMYTGLREGPWTYVVTRTGREVLFNRDVDRGELKNRARRKKYAADLERLRKLEKKYRNCMGKSCPGADTFTRAR